MKRGFTLVELIAVVIILGILVILAFPPMLSMINKSKNEVKEATKTLIYLGSEDYLNENINDYPKTNGKIYCLKIDELVKKDYISNNILEEVNKDQLIKVTVNNSKYNFELNNECTSN